jgi:hypothetical protein
MTVEMTAEQIIEVKIETKIETGMAKKDLHPQPNKEILWS